MTCYILFSLITATSMNSLILLSPITLGMNILVMSMITAILFSFMCSSWMAFLIFLIYISGTLVMFSYFVAMTPNIAMSNPIHLPLMIVSPIMILYSCMSMNMHTQQNQTLYIMNTFYNSNTMSMLIMLASILLITMVIVVKISTISKGPLRPFMNYV